MLAAQSRIATRPRSRNDGPIRAFCRASSSTVHYAFSGVWSLAPPLRLRGRIGVFHRRAAPPHRPSPGHNLLRVLAHSLLRTPGFALSGRGRLPQSVAFPSSRTTPLTLRHLLRLLGPRAGSPPWRHRFPSASCRVSPSTLRGPLHLLGQSGGFQAATTGLLGDPKNKVFMTIVPEAIDALQLLNSRCVLKHAIRECIRRWKTDAVGATLARSRRRKGRQTLGWECLFGKCFRGFFFCLASLWFPRLLLLLCTRALPLSSCCCPVGWLMLLPSCVAYTNSGRKGAI